MVSEKAVRIDTLIALSASLDAVWLPEFANGAASGITGLLEDMELQKRSSTLSPHASMAVAGSVGAGRLSCLITVITLRRIAVFFAKGVIDASELWQAARRERRTLLNI